MLLYKLLIKPPEAPNERKYKPNLEEKQQYFLKPIPTCLKAIPYP
jgi:hypothetical protein